MASGISLATQVAANTWPNFGVDESESSFWVGVWDGLRERHESFNRVFDRIGEKVVVDIGCGFGSIIFAYLRGKGLEPKLRVALDIEGENLRSPHHYDGRSRVNASFVDLPFRNRTVDIVYSHMTNVGEGRINAAKFWECMRVLKPEEGVYIAGTGDGPGFFGKIRGVRKEYIPFLGNLYFRNI